MKKIGVFAAAALTLAMLGGCATGKSPLDYETGIYVAPEKVQALKSQKATQEQVVAAIGYPNLKSEVAGKEMWTYSYNLITAIPFVGQNRAESTIFEWSKQGALLDAYKTGQAPGQSGNPLLKAAGM